MNYDMTDFAGKHIVFIGRGKEGMSFERFVKAYAGILSFTYIDQKDDPRYLEKLMQLDLSQTIVVKTPGCPGRIVPVPYVTPTQVFFRCARQLGAKIIGVTGTKGKTTTASLIAFMLKNGGLDAKLCGNVGVPMLDALEEATQNSIFVVELSSYQLNELRQSPDIAVITNLFRDHTDYHGNLEAYWEAKHNIIRYMSDNGALVYNPAYEMILHWIAEQPIKQAPIDPNETVDMSEAKIIGDHNRINFLMARTVAELCGVSRGTCNTSLKNFEPVRHRLQVVKTVNGVTYVDDAIGSTPEATTAGITALVRNRGPVGCVMLGGVNRGYDFTELVKLLRTLMIPKLVLFPDTGEIIKSMLPEDYRPEVFETRSMEEAVKWASENTPSGSICLLSTASPSTVLWSSFEEKGSLFQQYVLAI